MYAGMYVHTFVRVCVKSALQTVNVLLERICVGAGAGDSICYI